MALLASGWGVSTGLGAAASRRAPASKALELPPPLLKPRVITEAVPNDSDDPAIWVNRGDPARSLVLGTDKAEEGGLYAFDLAGKIVGTVKPLKYPNNVAVARDIRVGNETIDVALVTEARAYRLRAFRLPDLAPVDGGGFAVFDGKRSPWGVAVYQKPAPDNGRADGGAFVFLSGIPGPSRDMLSQYRLEDDGSGKLRLVPVRSFGAFYGPAEIEGMAVDAEAGFIYYSDERFGIRKYAAEAAARGAANQLAAFGRSGFEGDREGISIYPTGPRTGFILVSDQAAGLVQVFRREGDAAGPHVHEPVAKVRLSAKESDGNDVTATALPDFPGGLFVAMSTDKTFHFYAWDDFAANAGLLK